MMTPMRQHLAVLTLTGLLLAGCGSDDPEPAESEAPAESSTSSTTEAEPEPTETRPGDPAVYQRIDALTDCGALQGEFDIAATNNDLADPGTDPFDITLDYMRYTQDRIEELGCP